MRTLNFLLGALMLVFCLACDKNNEPNNTSNGIPASTANNDTLAFNVIGTTCVDSLLGQWKIQTIIDYETKQEIERIEFGSITIDTTETKRFTVMLYYANTLTTFCEFGNNNQITILNEWGGTELYDASGKERKILDLLNSVTHWINTDSTLYLICNKRNNRKYNAVCLKKN